MISPYQAAVMVGFVIIIIFLWLILLNLPDEVTILVNWLVVR